MELLKGFSADENSRNYSNKIKSSFCWKKLEIQKMKIYSKNLWLNISKIKEYHSSDNPQRANTQWVVNHGAIGKTEYTVGEMVLSHSAFRVWYNDFMTKIISDMTITQLQTGTDHLTVCTHFHVCSIYNDAGADLPVKETGGRFGIFPGGGMDYGEILESALKRGIIWEVGYKGTRYQLWRVGRDLYWANWC